MKRSKSENDIKNMTHHNNGIYRSITEHTIEINEIIDTLKYIETSIQELTRNISNNNTIGLYNELVILLLEYDIYQEILDCVSVQLEYNMNIL